MNINSRSDEQNIAQMNILAFFPFLGEERPQLGDADSYSALKVSYHYILDVAIEAVRKGQRSRSALLSF